MESLKHYISIIDGQFSSKNIEAFGSLNKDTRLSLDIKAEKLHAYSKLIDFCFQVLNEYYAASSNPSHLAILFAVLVENNKKINKKSIGDFASGYLLSSVKDKIQDKTLSWYLYHVMCGINSETKLVQEMEKALQIYKGYSIPYYYLLLEVFRNISGFEDKDSIEKFRERIYEYKNKLEEPLLENLLGGSNEFASLPSVDEYVSRFERSIANSITRTGVSALAGTALVGGAGLAAGASTIGGMLGSILGPWGAITGAALGGAISSSVGSTASLAKGELKKYDKKYRPSFLLQYLALQEEIYYKNKELEDKNKQLAELNYKNKLMVKRYSHSWANLLYPDTVFNVAKTLRNNPQYKHESLQLMRAYNNETLLRQQSYMLELRHSNDYLAVQQSIRKGISPRSVNETTKTIDYFIKYSLERVMFRIFMEDGERSKYIRKKLKENKFTTDSLKYSFTSDIVYHQQDIVEWFSSNLFTLNVLIDSIWSNIKILSESGAAAAFIVEIFTELFINALTYGSKNRNGLITLKLSSGSDSNVDYLEISMSNSTDSEDTYSGGTSDGLKSLNELLKMVNFKTKTTEDRQYLQYSTSNNEFKLNLYISKNLLIKKKIEL